MEYQVKREEFIKNIKPFLDKIQLNDIFFTQLKKHQRSSYLEIVKKFESKQRAQKVFIFYHFTSDQELLKILICALKNSEQIEMSNLLEKSSSQHQSFLVANYLFRFVESTILSTTFIHFIENHLNEEFQEIFKQLKESEMCQKLFIFLEFTRERSTCKKMVDILIESGMNDVAIELIKYNKSPPLLEIKYDLKLKVNPALIPMHGTEIYPIDKSIKGRCLIINNENMVWKESLRFQNIFYDLNFGVDLEFNLSTSKIRSKLQELATYITNSNKESMLAIMIISHGQDECVMGFNSNTGACDPNDLLKISDIVDYFACCETLEKCPKLFFFTCCRIEKQSTEESSQSNIFKECDQESMGIWQNNENSILKLKSEIRITSTFNNLSDEWINKLKDTFICYSCSKGEKTYFDNGYTFFGQALSHSISQFACEKSLQTIMCRTIDFMEMRLRDTNLSTPEIRAVDMRKLLFFNPGIIEDNTMA